jgi:hypothetical protein
MPAPTAPRVQPETSLEWILIRIIEDMRSRLMEADTLAGAVEWSFEDPYSPDFDKRLRDANRVTFFLRHLIRCVDHALIDSGDRLSAAVQVLRQRRDVAEGES